MKEGILNYRFSTYSNKFYFLRSETGLNLKKIYEK
jgi:hypothetical protein